MDVKQRNLCLLLIFGTILVHGQRRETNSVAYSPSYTQPRPTTDTDGAIYQKTVNGVSFKIVSMCQEFDTVFKPGIMEFKTLQGGCRFVVTFDRSLPTSQTIYTPSARPVYNQSPPRRYYQSQAAERVDPYYPPPKAPVQPPPPQEIRYAEPAVRQVVRERTYAAPPPPPPAQQYSPPEPTIRYVPTQQSAPATPPRNQQQTYIPRLAAPPTRVAAPPPRVAAPPPRVAAPPPPPRVAAPPPRGPPSQRAGPPPPHGTPYSSAGARPQPGNDPRRLDHFQMEALGLRQLHEGPPPPTPPPSDAPIPRI
ncbi:uncharacterized protein LOC126829824 [Patella vulgata]|uniref:uncharacterized protein LOC126829824 n=1 Tax=Patella vulgata TaxID=6465 RepID=UPI00218059A1|nr:uncharacterized protein LOC126829824 [Patella vulgata]